MSAISGTRRAIRELVDGTVRVQIDIDPAFRRTFFEMFPDIDSRVALAPLLPEHRQIEERGPGIGPLCRLAVQWTRDPTFINWINATYPGSGDGIPDIDETHVAGQIRKVCEVESRKEFDSDPAAAERFHRRIRIPFNAHLNERAS